MKTHPLLKVIVIILGAAAVGISAESRNMSPRALFDSIKVGMKREAVENFLGKPLAELGTTSYYLKPPEIAKDKSPMALGSIRVVYSASNEVESKAFFSDEQKLAKP